MVIKESAAKKVKAFDIIKEDNQYKLVNIEYNLEEGTAEIIGIFNLDKTVHITRHNIDTIISYKFKELNKRKKKENEIIGQKPVKKKIGESND